MAPVAEAGERRAAAGEARPPAAVAVVPEAGVIDAARRRQRRRRIGVAAVVVAAGVSALIVARGDDGRAPERRPSTPRAVAVAPDGVVARTYMGVSCHRANWIGCDRVGLAVWLKRPAEAVRATIAGRPLRLADPVWSTRPRMFAGFLQPAGMRSRMHVRPDTRQQLWFGEDAPSPLVRLWITYGDGRVITTRLRVMLAAGWG